MCERVKLTPLTPEEQAFAEENHSVLVWYLSTNKLDKSEFYDVAAIGYLQAVKKMVCPARVTAVVLFYNSPAVYAQPRISGKAETGPASHSEPGRYSAGNRGPDLWGIHNL